MNVYVVTFSTGAYADKADHRVIAFVDDADAANAYAHACNQYATAWESFVKNGGALSWESPPANWNPLHPAMSDVIDGFGSYWVEEVATTFPQPGPNKESRNCYAGTPPAVTPTPDANLKSDEDIDLMTRTYERLGLANACANTKVSV